MNRLLELTAQAEAGHFWFQGFRRFLTPVITNLAAGRRDLRLVDCGCGTGNNLSLLAPHGQAFAFDLSPWQARNSAAARGRLVHADLVSIPFASNTFDVATSFDVLQCVQNDEAALREMARVVRPGGAIVLTLAALEMLRGDHAEAWGEVRRYTMPAARRLVEQAGLRVERMTFLFASIFPLMLGVRVWQRAIRPLRGPRDDTDIRVPSAPVNVMLRSVLSAEAWMARYLPMPVGSSLLVVARKG